jgi:fumarylacetoacetate (FAA) hydrolase family protein
MAELTVEATLPNDHDKAALIGRVWVKDVGPCIAGLRGGDLVDLSEHAPTMSDLLDLPECGDLVRNAKAPVITALEDLLSHGFEGADEDPERTRLLAPVDLQAVKAAGVTFARSMLERVVEEQAKGDPGAALAARQKIEAAIGGELASLVPGSEAAMKLKAHLIDIGLWSQYLEVGIGPDAEIFTKCPSMAAVGHGARIGLHPRSTWNNPEPEVVLAVDSLGAIKGVTLGNDVNLRDFEGRSALLLSKAKDNNASAAIGPFIRLLDDDFTLDDLRSTVVTLKVEGEDGFTLDGASSMSEISRDPLDLAAATLNENHQYPDGFVLYCGTMFAPTKDRDVEGEGFTHKVGDQVTIAAERLGSLVNLVDLSCDIAPWRFGARSLMRNLGDRGLI